jgi:hypothetical protein
MTEVMVSWRSNLDSAQVGDRRSDLPVHIGMEMVTVVTHIITDAVGTATLEPMERNENGNWRRRSKSPATVMGSRDWRST